MIERKLIQRLREFGFTGPVKKGNGGSARKHQHMIRGEQSLSIPNRHGMKHRSEINANFIRSILKVAGISESDWDAKG